MMSSFNVSFFEHVGAILYDCPIFPDITTLFLSVGLHCKRQDFQRTCLRSLKRVLGLVQRKFPNLRKFSIPCISLLHAGLRESEKKVLEQLNTFLLHEVQFGGFVPVTPFSEVEAFISGSQEASFTSSLFKHWDTTFHFL